MTALSKDRPLERAAYRASDEAWSKAVRIARELDRVLDGDLPMREAVSRAAVELRLSTRQVYNHLARYRGECPIFCVSVIWSMLPERSKDDDDFERTAGRTAEGLQAA